MATALQNCERTGHNFVLNQQGDGFACSHDCGERRPRTVSCGCCTWGCICANHRDEPRGRPAKACDYHRDHGHPRVTSPVAAVSLAEGR